MAVFQVDVQTRAGAIYISNMYHVVAASLEAAREQALSIIDIQRATLPTFWSITAFRVATPAEYDNQFVSEPVSIPGTRTIGQAMPPFVRFRVDFRQGFRRPCRKFLIGVAESDSDGDTFTQAAIDFIRDSYINPILDVPDLVLCGPDGSLILGGDLSKNVGMRQLRRASKRKKPVI